MWYEPGLCLQVHLFYIFGHNVCQRYVCVFELQYCNVFLGGGQISELYFVRKWVEIQAMTLGTGQVRRKKAHESQKCLLERELRHIDKDSALSESGVEPVLCSSVCCESLQSDRYSTRRKACACDWG